MWNGNRQLLKRRKVLVILVLLAIGTLGILYLRFFKWVRHPRADLSRLAEFNSCMDELAETIIPETDTPGAKTAGVRATVFMRVKHCLDERDQSIFLQGLIDLDAYCKQKFGLVFAMCAEAERLQALRNLESDAMFGGWLITKVRQRLFGKPFIVLAKDLCVDAYCTSMQGATKALAFDPVPGHYNACVVMSEKQRSWALV